MDNFMDVLQKVYRMDEATCLEPLIQQATLPEQTVLDIQQQARTWMETIRRNQKKEGGLDAFLYQYDLSSVEGIALMSLAEALLRIPDNETADKLIKDKIASSNWEMHLGKSHAWFVNAATWGLLLTGKILKTEDQNANQFLAAIKKLISRVGEPVIREMIRQAMKILGKQFVMGVTITEALKRAKKLEAQGYRYSYDMLGEAAKTSKDAELYFNAYQEAIHAIHQNTEKQGPILGPGISVKLSALHPRFEWNQRETLFVELMPKLKELALQAMQANIGFTIDAEEAERLTLSLYLMESLLEDPIFRTWQGFGLAIQAYQKRGAYVIDWAQNLANVRHQPLMIRLVKGAYWDSEIKWSQEKGLKGYPVFTRKVATDVSYLACTKKLLTGSNWIYPQFATHNAYTASAVIEMAKALNKDRKFEFQCLHGMGEALYHNIVGPDKLDIPCRIYAPVGGHEHLLGYLVRRLLENGANTSFVNRIIDEQTPIDELIQDPVLKLQQLKEKAHPKIPLPVHLFGEERPNSQGVDLTNPEETEPLLKSISAEFPTVFQTNVEQTNLETLSTWCDNAFQASLDWDRLSPKTRAEKLKNLALLLEKNQAKLLALLIREGGKTVQDAISELREAIDYCWYYRYRLPKDFAIRTFRGPTGEQNQLTLHGRGVFACISPWNFPLAIFLGQITGALMAGNAVIAKPASQTPLIALETMRLIHEAGFPKELVQLAIGSGSKIGQSLLTHPAIRGVMFTGSTETGKEINQTLANRLGPLIPIVAETGGQNAMIVDSSALPEQVITDVLTSAFNSAGQRCSALRVLFVQQDISDRIIDMLQGAMAELKIGDPFDLPTDVGPMIDAKAVDTLKVHQAEMNQSATLLYQCTLPRSLPNLPRGAFFAPCAYELTSLKQLKNENFGPILHVIRYKGNELDKVIEDIRATGFGLTLGIHSRIAETIDYLVERLPVGNMYVNRNMIGAVVGVQPFGGEGLSGTGPKAGGPHILSRLATERTLSVNLAATGGNTQLLMLD